VTYNDKHNDANGEENRDGTNDNGSWNCGAKGPTDDAEILKLRERQKRNLVTTLLLSQGVPMILGGDELSHSQQGNNNAYCQDNELTWLKWELDEPQTKFLDFVKKVILIWQTHPVFQRRNFFHGRSIRGTDVKDISWLGPDGLDMDDQAWSTGYVRCLGVRLAGDLIADVNERGEPIVGDTILMLLNAHHEAIPFTLPKHRLGQHWECLFDTTDDKLGGQRFEEPHQYALEGRSVALFRTCPEDEDPGMVIAPAQAAPLVREIRRSPSSSDRPA
jgi:isoamylase